LGLLLIKLQTEDLNGEIKLESIPVVSTTFTVSFPDSIVVENEIILN